MGQSVSVEGGAGLRAVDFPKVDQPLREDVKRIGALVGEILADQLGPEFLAEVERVRAAAIGRREAGAPVEALADLLAQTQHRAADLARAFSTYFQAINVAERVHRIRRRRDYERAGAEPQPGGLRAVIGALLREGVSAEDLAQLLGRMRVEPVFTAHPTEAVRRSLLDKEQALVQALIADIDRQRTPAERRADQERMRLALTAGWQTADAASERPTVADETEHVSYFLADVLYAVVPVFYEVLRDVLDEAGQPAIPLSTLLRFGTWVGGDMDGNPNVGADTIAATLAAQRAQVIAAYRREVSQLERLLSQSGSRVAVDPAILQRLADYRERLPRAAARQKSRYADMPYRLLLELIAARLAATAAEREGGYADVAEFRGDIALVADSLLTHGGRHAGWLAVQRLLLRIDTFGFHLATLDLRQESSVHEAAVGRILQDDDWTARPLDERRTRLVQRLQGDGGALAPLDDPCLAVFRTVAQAQQRYGAAAIGPYIISMNRSAVDVLSVLVLAQIAGCVDAQRVVPLDVAPLFETVADLQAAPDVLAELFADPVYRAHLARRGDRQIVMLGYSDSAKDGGLFASRWALQRTQVILTELARRTGVRIAFFHGRGGSISRGGGKTERAVVAAPRGSVDGFLRLTEQGEVIHRKYGIKAIALRNLEQTTGAVLRASLRPRPPEPRETAWREMASTMAEAARLHYRALVHETEGFADYFRAATPIDVIERLRIGSRPPRRGGAGGIDRLRAIPWVFAWSQNRAGLTAWYGVGTGLCRGIERYGRDALREMAADWPFFATLIDDIEMVLAKCDMAIYARYSLLAGPLHAVFHPPIAAEFERTRQAVLDLKQSDTLLAGDRRLRESIRLRNPYVDPISLLQVDLLAKWRAAERPEGDLFQALAATVNGIAAGVQNTG
ncbi:phosphoenolpyruvate carboxylase [Tahibacter amnicola]|uniref:Phosphoenolpyruvate carboxylase n=1 Tax=Tahibacter amnicola TaxID=2976241 RepID=A0ABY6BEM5_9GAMM|nr:phosphoenolpyruvate carboxylase [Tahibacter amnicola]UXI68199.1 phosphoenolpyruvate carboxylase [Tahibacter amnicola]